MVHSYVLVERLIFGHALSKRKQIHGQFSSTLYTIPQEEGSSDAKFSYVMYIVCYGIVHVHQRTCLAILRDFTMSTFQ